MGKISDVGEKRFRDDALEQEICAYILRKKPMYVNKVEPEWFTSEIISNAIKVQKKFKALLSRATLIAELKKGRYMKSADIKLYSEVLDEIYDVSISRVNDRSIDLIRAQMIELCEGRNIMNGLQSMLTNLKNNSVDDMKHTLKGLGAGIKTNNEITTGGYIQGLDGRIARIEEKQKLLAEGKSVGVPTGIRIFDFMIGGLMPAEFGVVGGQPGVGKSALLQAFALNAWRQDYNVLYVTGEMPKHDVEFRMDSDVAHISSQKFRMGNLTDKDIKNWKTAIEREQDLRAGFLEVVSFPKDFCAADVMGQALQIQDQYEKEIDLICLDYINVMQSNSYNRKGSKSWDSQADVVWEVKELCAELNDGVCLWTAGQITDEFIDAPVLALNGLKYARAISETAPIVLGLVRSEDEESEGTLELQILKMRNAPIPDKSILLRPNLEYMRIHEELVKRSKSMLDTVASTTKRKTLVGKKK